MLCEYQDFYPIEKWELIEVREYCDFNEIPFLAFCLKVGELVQAEYNGKENIKTSTPIIRWIHQRDYFKLYDDCGAVVW